MKSLIFAGFGVLALCTAAPAAADTDDIASWGNENLGGSVGTTGGSVSVAGVTTSVDGIGTLHGTTSVVGNGWSSTVDQHYSLTEGLETEWSVTDRSGDNLEVEGYIYPHSTWATLEAVNTPAQGEVQAFQLVCDPICDGGWQ